MFNCLLVGSSGNIGSEIKKIKSVNFICINRNTVDLLDFEKTEKYLDTLPKINSIIFLVGLAHNKGKKNDYQEHLKANYETLINLINVLKKNNSLPQKIIFTSTISIYGENRWIKNYNEETVANPFSPYAVTKKMAEDYLSKYFENQSWILRLAPVYKKDFLLNIMRRTKILNFNYKIGSGNCKLSLCNIKNITTTVENILLNKVPYGVYIISDPLNYSYNDLLKWRKAKNIILVPRFAILVFYYIGKLFKNTFIIENSIKLLTSNLYSSEKIRKHINLNHSLKNYEYEDG